MFSNDHFVPLYADFYGILWRFNTANSYERSPKDTSPDPLESHDWFCSSWFPIGSIATYLEARCFIPFS